MTTRRHHHPDQADKLIPRRQTANPARPEPARPALLQRAMADPNVLSPADLYHLQQTVGNRAAGQLVARSSSPPGRAQSVIQRGKDKKTVGSKIKQGLKVVVHNLKPKTIRDVHFVVGKISENLDRFERALDDHSPMWAYHYYRYAQRLIEKEIPPQIVLLSPIVATRMALLHLRAKNLIARYNQEFGEDYEPDFLEENTGTEAEPLDQSEESSTQGDLTPDNETGEETGGEFYLLDMEDITQTDKPGFELLEEKKPRSLIGGHRR